MPPNPTGQFEHTSRYMYPLCLICPREMAGQEMQRGSLKQQAGLYTARVLVLGWIQPCPFAYSAHSVWILIWVSGKLHHFLLALWLYTGDDAVVMLYVVSHLSCSRLLAILLNTWNVRLKRWTNIPLLLFQTDTAVIKFIIYEFNVCSQHITILVTSSFHSHFSMQLTKVMPHRRLWASMGRFRRHNWEKIFHQVYISICQGLTKNQAVQQLSLSWGLRHDAHVNIQPVKHWILTWSDQWIKTCAGARLNGIYSYKLLVAGWKINMIYTTSGRLVCKVACTRLHFIITSLK